MVTKNRAVKWEGVAKIDLTAAEGAGDACVGRIALPPGHHNGETVFVPRCAARSWEPPAAIACALPLHRPAGGRHAHGTLLAAARSVGTLVCSLPDPSGKST